MKKELILFLSISFGVFLFVLSFQPFPHDEFDFYYRLLFKFGFAAIVFLFMFLVRILYPFLMCRITKRENETAVSFLANGIVIWALSSFAFVCFLKYVGFISITGYIVFKVILICLAPPVILLISDRMRKVKLKNESLIAEKEKNQKQFSKTQEDYQYIPIDFVSGVNGQKLRFILGKILFIKSANNYVEVHYLEEDQIKKKLVRNTLTNIALQIKPYTCLIRCHRTCIVNIQYIENKNDNCNDHALTIRGYHEQIPVSRRYYLNVKEAL